MMMVSMDRMIAYICCWPVCTCRNIDCRVYHVQWT